MTQTEKLKKERKKNYDRNYYQKNKQKLRDYQNEYYNQNRANIVEKHKEHSKGYYLRNKEEIKLRIKKYRKDNPRIVIKADANYYKKHKDKCSTRAITRYRNEKKGICEICKEKIKTDFHHVSYNPNVFIEVCKRCHWGLHKSK